MATAHPEVLWAQRSSKTDAERNFIYLTIQATDVPKAEAKIDLQPTSLKFTGKSTTKNVTYAVDIEFFEEIDVENSKINHSSRNIEMVLRKKEVKEEFWPRLLKEKARMHWLKTDFDKWADEDEQDPAEDEDFMAKAGGMEGMGGMGGMGGGMPGMPGGMGGMGGMGGGFEGIDFSKFGSGPGGAMGDMPDDDDDEDLPEDDDDDDDEMPPLEGEEKTPAAKLETKAHPGIEEVE